MRACVNKGGGGGGGVRTHALVCFHVCGASRRVCMCALARMRACVPACV